MNETIKKDLRDYRLERTRLAILKQKIVTQVVLYVIDQTKQMSIRDTKSFYQNLYKNNVDLLEFKPVIDKVFEEYLTDEQGKTK